MKHKTHKKKRKKIVNCSEKNLQSQQDAKLLMTKKEALGPFYNSRKSIKIIGL